MMSKHAYVQAPLGHPFHYGFFEKIYLHAKKKLQCLRNFTALHNFGALLKDFNRSVMRQ